MPHFEHHPARLLAIDDSLLIHRLLKAHLRNEAVELHCATSGEEGLQMARALSPDAILLDVDMGGISGFDVLSSLKSDQATHHIPIIFLSGSCKTEDRVRGLDLGAVDFILKPFEIAELKARVRSALRMTRLIKMLARRAQIDGMTGLWNRTYFDDRLQREVAEALRHDQNLALIICDLDHFKTINDRFGHPFGDQVLEDFALLLGENRMTDVICRYGGEEFGLLLPQESADTAAVAAERVRAALQAKTWHVAKDLVVTASFGVADLSTAASSTPQMLVASADRALYAAKQSGRNRVCVDGVECARQYRRSA